MGIPLSYHKRRIKDQSVIPRRKIIAWIKLGNIILNNPNVLTILGLDERAKVTKLDFVLFCPRKKSRTGNNGFPTRI